MLLEECTKITRMAILSRSTTLFSIPSPPGQMEMEIVEAGANKSGHTVKWGSMGDYGGPKGLRLSL